jgi:diguanylate cyclase (GGDEF)-like protein
MHIPKILIVEDNKDMRQILIKNLSFENYETIEAQNAEIALQKFENDPPDLVLLDVMLPGMSGIDALRIMIKTQLSNFIPIIIITAKSEINDIVTGLEAGATDYIVKPFHYEELVARIKSALRLKELNDLVVNKKIELEKALKENEVLNETLLNKNKDLRRNIYRLHEIFSIAMDLNSILDLKTLINSILLTFIGEFSCKTTLFLLSGKKTKNRLAVFNSKGFFRKDLENLVVEKSDSLIGYLQPVVYPQKVKDLVGEVNDSFALKKLNELNIEIVTPVIVKKDVEGIICLGPRVGEKDYDKKDLEHFTILVNFISGAIENAALYREVEELSYTDGMTSLHNYRYFELRLIEEVSRHHRTKSGLSLLILDIDHFKIFNDTLGHQAGDEVLRTLAELLKETVRDNDIVARYGGEEFAIILPSVPPKGATILAERIRKLITETSVPGEEVQPGGKLTVSIGSASMPHDTEDWKDLIYKADTALYTAKRSGRNQVRLFDKEMVM